MLNINDMQDRDKLSQSIYSQIHTINNFINYKNSTIEIHINSPREVDYSRSAFTLYGLSAAFKSGFKNNIDLDKITNLYTNIYDKSKALNNIKDSNHLYVILYGMRMLHNLGMRYDHLIAELDEQSMAHIYSYPVLNYIFMSTYKECGLMRDNGFITSVYLQAYNVMEYILYTDIRNQYLPFHYVELSYIDKKLGLRADLVMRERFDKDYPSNIVSTSGVAKCLEHYTRVYDEIMILRCFEFINSRSVAINPEFLRPDVLNLKHELYRETDSSNYICLDTNTHLLLSYINAYNNLTNNQNVDNLKEIYA